MKAENEIRHHVVEALRSTDQTSRVGVAVEREIVTLAGTVGSLDAKTSAEEIASRVPGVSAVINHLQVGTPSWIHPLVETVLLPVDLSDERVGSLRYAHLLAEKFGARVTILYVDPIAPRPGQEKVYAERLERTLELYATPHLEPYPFDIAVADGDAGRAILAQAERSASDLIVMGTSGREHGGHDPTHSVSLAVVRGSSCPVLTMGEHDYPPVQRGVGISTIVCPVNLTAAARESVLYAAKLADAFRAHLIVVRVVEPEENTELGHEERLLHSWLGDHLPGTRMRGVKPYRQIVVRGRATETVLEWALKSECDLLVVGAERKITGELVTMGTTTEGLLRSATTPVLIVPRRGE
jgi:nucleotide-binding universal stress UspA family protein